MNSLNPASGMGASSHLNQSIKKLLELESLRRGYERDKTSTAHVSTEIDALQSRLVHVDDLYKMPATTEDVDNLSKLFGVGFMIGAGLDMSQVVGTAKNPDRTVFACVGRGIVNEDISYYFLLDLFIAREQHPSILQDRLIEWSNRYGWIDKVVIESFQGMWMHQWCLDQGYDAELLAPSYKNQKLTFKNFYRAVNGGYFKAPTVPYYTDEDGNLLDGYSTKQDILRDELGVFQHIDMGENRGKFGSPEKRSNRKGAIKDDTVYAVNWAIHATQGETITDLHLRDRTKQMTMSDVYSDTDHIGDYGEEDKWKILH